MIASSFVRSWLQADYMPVLHGRCLVYRGAHFANHSGSVYCTTLVLRFRKRTKSIRLDLWVPCEMRVLAAFCLA